MAWCLVKHRDNFTFLQSNGEDFEHCDEDSHFMQADEVQGIHTLHKAVHMVRGGDGTRNR
jgi:hypothetical protein